MKMNNRGSALGNVLVMIALLMIAGVAVAQVVSADANFARLNRDGTQAFQLAEGGIDYGMELLTNRGTDAVAPGEPYLLDLGTGLVEVEILEGIYDAQYIIISSGTKGSTTRTVKATVGYVHASNPFPYSLFVGGAGDETLHLKNITIQGPVYISSKKVILDGVTFHADVHFDSDEVTISNDSNIRTTSQVSCATHTVLHRPNSTNHWSWTRIQRIDLEETFPDINIVNFGTYETFEPLWPVETTSVNFVDLQEKNYFPGDITIVVNKSHGVPTWDVITIACNGTVTFDVPNQLTHYTASLIVMAEGDIVDISKMSANTDVDLYLYAKGSIITDQNVTMSSVMAQVVAITHNQNQTIKPPDPSIMPLEVREAWQTHGIRIINWEN